MTVTYTLEVSKAQLLGFPKLLARWKGSIYRLIYREMLVFILAFYAIMLTYRYVLNDRQREIFENVSLYCREFSSVVMVTFVLGFYVTLVMGRWWQQYMNIPWPDRISMQITAYVQGHDDRSRMIRRALARYLNLLSLFTFQNTSTVIKRRFPTLQHIVDAGIMTQEEFSEIENMPTQHGYWWVPAHWFVQLVIIARKEGRIHDDFHVKTLIDDVMDYRGMCGMIWSYDWISVPLVYTQVVTIAVYSFFVASLFGRQYLLEIDKNEKLVDFYCPLFTIFQFCFFVGWLKVAESMICPFGEDDDDFDLNWIIDRNIFVAYQIVDPLHRKVPNLSKDAFWDDHDPSLPYTQAAAQFRSQPFVGSTTGMNIPEKDALWEVPEGMPAISEEDGINEYSSKRQRDDDDNISSASSDRSSQNSRTQNRRRGLGGLLLGFSREKLGGRLGSKFSSVSSIFTGNKACSPPPSVQFRRAGSRMRNFDSNASEDPVSLRDLQSVCNSAAASQDFDPDKLTEKTTALQIVPEHEVMAILPENFRKKSLPIDFEENFNSRTPLCEKN